MRILVAVAVVAVSCGSVPREGDECVARVCDYSTDGRILECLDGHLRAFPCNSGCRADSDGNDFCDSRGAQAGDACPPELGLLSTCGAAHDRLLCFSGIWQHLDECDVQGGDDFSLCRTDDSGLNARCLSCTKTAPALCHE